MARALRRSEWLWLLAVAVALAWPTISLRTFHSLLPGHHAIHEQWGEPVALAQLRTIEPVVDPVPGPVAQAILEMPADRVRSRARRGDRSLAVAALPMSAWLLVGTDRVSLSDAIGWALQHGGGRTLGNAIRAALHWGW